MGETCPFSRAPCWVQGVYYKCSFQGGSFFRFGWYGSTYWITTKSGEKKLESCQLGTPSKFQKSLGVGETSENESHGWAGFCLWVRWHTHIKKVEHITHLNMMGVAKIRLCFFSVNNVGTNYQPQLVQEFWTISTRWVIDGVIIPLTPFHGHFFTKFIPGSLAHLVWNFMILGAWKIIRQRGGFRTKHDDMKQEFDGSVREGSKVGRGKTSGKKRDQPWWHPRFCSRFIVPLWPPRTRIY